MPIPTPTYYWKFDESSGSSASEQQSGNTITFQNTPTWTTGVVGNAVQPGVTNRGYFNTNIDLSTGGF